MGKYSKKTHYRKLVRDSIPQYLKEKGVSHETHTATEEEFHVKLAEKLVEEAQEVAKADSRREIKGELADVCEVIDELKDFYKIETDELKAAQEEKRKQRGGFKRRTILDWS